MRSLIVAPVTPGIGSSRAGKTSITIAMSASAIASANSRAKVWVREYVPGWKTAIRRPSPASACRAAASEAAISVGWWA